MRVTHFKIEIAQLSLSDLGRNPLHFDSPTTRMIKSGS
jgi:hypothetical protein